MICLMGDRAIRNLVRDLTLAIALAGMAMPAMLAAQDDAGEDVRFAEKMPLADETLVLDATHTGFGAVAVGARGHVLLTDDYETWRQAERVPTRATLTGVDFEGRDGWAVGHDAVIIHTGDGGETWERQFFAPEREQPFLDVLFLDESRGFAIGAYGMFLRTTDGGNTWTEDKVIETDDWHLNAMTRAEDGTLYIAAERGIIYRSLDGGRTWDATDLSYQGSMFDILTLPDGEVLAFGLRGRAFHTTDGGETWQQVDTPTDSSLQGGRVLQSGRLVIVGGNGVILERAPGGSAFSLREHPSDEPLAGVLQGADGHLIYYGLNGIGPAESNGEAP